MWEGLSLVPRQGLGTRLGGARLSMAKMAEMPDVVIVDSTPLGMGDLSDILKELNGVAAQWKLIGIHLGIRIDKLNNIQSQEESPTKCLTQMFTSWLKRAYDVKRFGEPTWVKLVEVVGHEAGGGDPSLATEIAERHKSQVQMSARSGLYQTDLRCAWGDGIQLWQQKTRERSAPTQSDGEGREREIRELQQEKELQQHQEERDQQIRVLQQQLQDCDSQIREKDAVIAMKLQELQKLQQELEQTAQDKRQQIQQTQEKYHISKARERQLREQLVASEQVTVQLQQKLLQREDMIQELQKENQHLQESLEAKNELLQQATTVSQKRTLKLSWKTCNTAPYKMYRGSATVHGSIVYLQPATESSQIQTYNLNTEEWSILPECPVCAFTVEVVNGLVTTIGGRQFGVYTFLSSILFGTDTTTNALLSLLERDGEREWVEYFPPMPTKRYHSAVVCSGKALVVAGGCSLGKGSIALTTVEVMDTDTLQWSTAISLPHPLLDASATVCGDSIYLVGGVDQYGIPTTPIFTHSLSALLAENNLEWHTLSGLPVDCSTCVKLNEQLLAVGGQSDGKETNAIYVYNPATNSWKVISHMPTPRSMCLVVVLPCNKLMVVGGLTGCGETDQFEIATANLNRNAI